MGEASRRKGLVEEARKKIGDEAATVVSALDARHTELQLQHRSFVFEVEGLRREVAIAKAGPAELRRDVLAFRGDLVMKAEQLENLGLRLTSLQTAITVDGMTLDEVKLSVSELKSAIDLIFDEHLAAIRDNAGTDARRLATLDDRVYWFESGLTCWQRLRWLCTGRLPRFKRFGNGTMPLRQFGGDATDDEDDNTPEAGGGLHPLPYRADG